MELMSLKVIHKLSTDYSSFEKRLHIINSTILNCSTAGSRVKRGKQRDLIIKTKRYFLFLYVFGVKNRHVNILSRLD